jgi:D-cysteine desulfhydrase
VPVEDLRVIPSFLSRLAPADYWIGPGGMGAIGSSGYYDAALELAEQVARGKLPAPDWIVLATGSGSTAAGLLAGLAVTSLRTHLMGVLAASNPAIRPIVLAQSAATARLRNSRFRWAEASAQIDFDSSLVGAGYGHPMRRSHTTHSTAARAGIALDPTYTEKAFSRAIALATALPSANVLFWNTLSSRPLGPLLANAPSTDELPKELLRLMTHRSPDRV